MARMPRTLLLPIVAILLCPSALHAQAAARRPSAAPASLQVLTVPGRPGETCFILVGANNTPLAHQCTYGRVWTT